MARSSLRVLLLNNSAGTKAAFWILYFVSLATYHLLYYVCRCCIVLLFVEERPTTPTKERPPIQRTQSSTLLLQPDSVRDQDDWNVVYRAPKPSWPVALLQRLQHIISAPFTWIWHGPPSENNMGTSSFFACLRRIQYTSGATWWPLRGTGSYLLYWFVMDRLLLIAVGGIVFGVEVLIGFLLALIPPVGRAIGFPPHSTIAIGIAGLLVDIILKDFVAFVTLRFLSRDTGWNTNVVTTNIWHPQLFRAAEHDRIGLRNWLASPGQDQRRSKVHPASSTLLSLQLYTSAEFAAAVGAYYMISDLNLNEFTSLNISPVTNSRHKLARIAIAYGVFAAIKVFVVAPAFFLLCRKQAQLMSPMEPTIVKIARAESYHRRFFTRKELANMLSWPDLRRIVRVLIQMTTVIVGIVALLGGLWFALLRSMAGKDLLCDWLIREHFDFGLSVTFFGIVRNTFYPFYGDRIWWQDYVMS